MPQGGRQISPRVAFFGPASRCDYLPFHSQPNPISLVIQVRPANEWSRGDAVERNGEFGLVRMYGA